MSLMRSTSSQVSRRAGGPALLSGSRARSDDAAGGDYGQNNDRERGVRTGKGTARLCHGAGAPILGGDRT